MESVRLPNKPLIDINGTPMVVRTSLQSIKAVGRENVFVATDSSQIENVCNEYNINTIITSNKCKTGTDRVCEASNLFNDDDIIINVQGDEPFIEPENIIKLIEFKKKSNNVVTAISNINFDSYNNSSIVKVVCNNNKLIYASRAPIPSSKSNTFKSAFKQLPIYGFTKHELKKFREFGKGHLESIEDVEILRFLEMEMCVEVINLNTNSISIDTESDLNKLKKIIKDLED